MDQDIKTVIQYPVGATEFDIPFDYLSRKFVRVSLVADENRRLLSNITEYRYVSKTRVKLLVDTTGFDRVEIRRFTSASERVVDFSDGSVLRAVDLNVSQLQSSHIAEEARDAALLAMPEDDAGNLDARNRKIVRLAPGENGTDAVNKDQLDTTLGEASGILSDIKDLEGDIRDYIENFANDTTSLKGIMWVYNGGSAIGGETSFVIRKPGVVLAVPAIYINGDRQAVNYQYSYNSLTKVVTLAKPLSAGDFVECATSEGTIPFENVLSSPDGADRVGFINGLNIAVPRTVAERLRDQYNAKDFGIKGDGVTDDSAAAQRLVDAVSAAGGGTIFWPKGIYKLNFVTKNNVSHVGCTYGSVRGIISFGAAIAKYATQFTPARAGFIIDTPTGGADCGGVIGIDFKGGGMTTQGGGLRLRAGSNDWIVSACKWDYFADEALITDGLIGRFSDLSGTNCLLNRARTSRTGVFVFNGADNFIERIQGNTGITAIYSNDLYLCGIVIGGANNYAINLEGELSEIGVAVTTVAAMHKLSNCRADLNYGHGFHGTAMFSNCHSLNNSRNSPGVYHGFILDNRSQLSNCRADGQHNCGIAWLNSADQAVLSLKPRVSAFHSTGHTNAAISDSLFNGFLHVMYDGFHRGTGSTPIVEGISTYVPIDTSPTDITNLLGGVKGQRVIIFGNSNITLVRSSTFVVKGCTADGRKQCRLGNMYEFWRGNGVWYEVGAQTPAIGSTANRPNSFSSPGDSYFDTTLNKPIWKKADNTGWVDSTGATV